MSEYRDPDHIKSYVKRATRMSASQKRAYQTYRGRFCISEAERRLIRSLPVAQRTGGYTSHFESPAAPLVVEIGFGMGDATAEVAAANPGTNYLGIEVHRPGVGKLLDTLAKRDLRNVRIVEGDAILVLENELSPGSVDRFHILFPDPWPKKRHHKRRLIRPAIVSLLASRLKAGGIVYMATDWEEYALQAVDLLEADSELENAYDRFAPGQTRRAVTAFERKGREAGRTIREILFRRLPCT